jgi:hypothetical protein
MSPIERSGGGGGSSAGGLIKLFESTLGAAAASIDTGANGIAAGHGDLILFSTTRTDQAGPADVFIRFNGDSAAHYDDALMRNVGGALSALSDQGVTSAEYAQEPGTGTTAGYAATCVGFIPGYDKTVFFKGGITASGQATDVVGSVRMIFNTLSWRSTVAINQLSIFPVAGNFIAGSRLVIYGTQ